MLVVWRCAEWPLRTVSALGWHSNSAVRLHSTQYSCTDVTPQGEMVSTRPRTTGRHTRGHRTNTTLTLVYCSTGLIILTAVSCVISSGNQAILTKGQKIALDCCTELRTAGPTALIRHRVGERLGGRRDCSATLSVIKPAESLRLSLPAQYYSTAHCTQVHCRRLPSVRL